MPAQSLLPTYWHPARNPSPSPSASLHCRRCSAAAAPGDHSNKPSDTRLAAWEVVTESITAKAASPPKHAQEWSRQRDAQVPKSTGCSLLPQKSRHGCEPVPESPGDCSARRQEQNEPLASAAALTPMHLSCGRRAPPHPSPEGGVIVQTLLAAKRFANICKVSCS